ncbi:hypothetical protein [Methanoregula sp. UBA64]|jgi:hypothetical protein|uniref:hypothetical protein n=1 Tax=Methanoregula sp. UBA64 TaxID=1915554 RepID=UPI0025EDB2D1|nr:hypothetical protein [Methanoregula sp. UBA64]
MAKKSRRFIWQFVICLGFLSGIWTAIGLDPGDLLISVVGSAIDSVFPSPLVRYLFVILPTILLAISVIGAYRKGNVLGLVSVLVAYGAGLVILAMPGFGLVLLALAAAVGYCAAAKRRKGIV